MQREGENGNRTDNKCHNGKKTSQVLQDSFDKNHSTEIASDSEPASASNSGVDVQRAGLNFTVVNIGGTTNAALGPGSRMTVNLMDCTNYHEDNHPEQYTSSYDDQSGTSELVADVEKGRKPRSALRFALLLTHCVYGVSLQLLREGWVILVEGLQTATDHVEIIDVSDFVNLLRNHMMIRTSSPTETIALDRIDLKALHSLNRYSEDQREVSVVFYKMLLHILEVRRHSVSALHREAVNLAKPFLDRSSHTSTPMKARLHLALGKRMAKVGTLKDAYNYVEKGVSYYKTTGIDTETRQHLVEAFVAIGKIVRRRGASLHGSLNYLNQAMDMQVEIDGCSSASDIRSLQAARIQVAICETYLSMGSYKDIILALQNTQLERVVRSDNEYHLAQYLVNLGCAVGYSGNHREGIELLSEALRVSENDACNYRRPLYYSLKAKVLVHLWEIERDQSQLHDAEMCCVQARNMLSEDHGEEHRFFALNEASTARVMFAKFKATVTPDQPQSNDLMYALAHANKALKVFLTAYDNVWDHPNVASTLQLVGDMCAYLSNSSCQDQRAKCQHYLNDMRTRFNSKRTPVTPCNPTQYACHFYDCASTIMKRCSPGHPRCSTIKKALASLLQQSDMH